MQCSCNEDNSFRGQYSQSSLYIDVVPAKIPTAFFFFFAELEKGNPQIHIDCAESLK